MIEFDSVSIDYLPEFKTLYNVNFKINNNAIFIGTDFDGAVSIFRILSKIDKHYSGSVLLDNKNIKNIKDKELSVGYVCYPPILNKNKSIYQNISYSLKIRKYPEKEIAVIINDYFLKFCWFFKFLDKQKIKNSHLKDDNINLSNCLQILKKIKVKKLTSTEQKMIAFLRAIVWQPKILLLEYFFDDLSKKDILLFVNKLHELNFNSQILVVEKDEKFLQYFNNYNKYHVTSSVLKEYNKF